jgi:uncharacterized membrane protein YkoI
MRFTTWLVSLGLGGVLGLACTQAFRSDAGPGTGKGAGKPAAQADDEVEIPLDQVPAAARAAAEKAVAGIAFTSAEREVENGVTVYCLMGSAAGKTYEVEVTAGGQVREVEQGDDDDDDGDDDDDDDGDDDGD